MGYQLPLSDPLLDTVDISVNLSGLQILDGVSIQVPEGSVTGLIGPNGAGKTTVFNVISGFISADSGKVRFQGMRMRHTKPHQLTKLGIARTLQSVGLFPSLTALENIVLGGSSRMRAGIIGHAFAMPWVDVQENHIRESALSVMQELDIVDVADRYPSELPYPIQKRVALARALVSDPTLIMLDEPAGGVSASDIEDLARLIRSWTPRRTVLLVEHHMELVMEVCDLIWVLDAGKVIAAGTPEEVRSNPAVLAAYLGNEEVQHAGG
jgi:branched-chain amino acid transport system ATP-binding protein